MADAALEYPYPLDLRWNHIQWFPIFFRRFLYSDFGWSADLDVRGASMTLMCAAMEMHPPGTLPRDPDIMHRYARVDPDVWQNLMAREIPPLYKWVEIRCGNETRLTHPMLLEALEVAVKAHKLRQRGTRSRKMWEPPDAGRAPG